MHISYYGHSCFYIETQGKKLIVDPFISGNSLANKLINIGAIQVDYILLTHAHQDHVLDVPAIMANNPEALIISNFEIATYYQEKNYNALGMNHGGHSEQSCGSVKYVHAVHSSTFADGSPGGNPGGFVLHNEEAGIYIAGDTAATKDMELIPLLSPKLDMAILPVGDLFTMNYQEACMAADMVNCNTILGCHFDTFPPIEIDHEVATAYFKKRGKTLLLPRVAQSFEVWSSKN